MKRTLLPLMIIFAFIMCKSQNITKPDFAYPQTTAKTADQELKHAIDARDARTALDALIVYALAQNMVDDDQLKASIILAEQTAAKFEDSNLYPLYQSLIAQMYFTKYSSNAWTYDQRQLPLEPLPSNLDEWSGAQFKIKIRELCRRSIDLAVERNLMDMPVAEYKDIVEAKGLSAIYYPTLMDFVVSNGTEILSEINENDEIKDIYAKALSLCSVNSANYILWKSKILGLCIDNSIQPISVVYDDLIEEDIEESPATTYTFDLYKSAIDECTENKYASLLLDNLYSTLSTVEEKEYFMLTAERFLEKYPDTPFAENLKKDIAYIRQCKVVVDVPNVVSYYDPLKAQVTVYNANQYKLDVYYLGSDNINVSNMRAKQIENFIANHKPQQSIDCHAEGTVPFIDKTTVDIRLPEPGYYIIVPNINGKKGEHNNLTITQCIPVYPLCLIDDCGNVQVSIVNPTTGAPIGDATVMIKNDNGKLLASGTTDASGIVSLEPESSDRYSNRLYVKYQGKTYNLTNISLWRYRSDDYDKVSYNANLLTDRGIYHPGDEVNVLAILSESSKSAEGKFSSRLTADQKVIVRLRDVNMQVVAEDTLRTDSYGRVNTSFSLPQDGLTGTYRIDLIIVSDGGERFVNNAMIMVSDYRMPDFEITIDALAYDTPNQGDVTVSGCATTYSGMPLSDTKIDLMLSRGSNLWWRTVPEEKVFSTDVMTDDYGKYTYTISKDIFAGKTKVPYILTLDAVSASGSIATTTRVFALSKAYQITATLPDNTVNGELPLKPNVKVYDAEGNETEIPMVWKLKLGNQVVAQGDYFGSIDISKAQPSEYTLTIEAKDSTLASPVNLTITVYNKAMGIVPQNMTIWIQKRDYTVTDSTPIDIDYGTGSDVTYMYIAEQCGEETRDIKLQKEDYGYHTLRYSLPDGVDGAVLMLYCLKDMTSYVKYIYISRAKEAPLKITGQSFRDRLIPGSQETWQIQISKADGTPVETALALDMYNKALDDLYSHTFNINFPTYYFINHLRVDVLNNWSYTNTFKSIVPDFKTVWLDKPSFNFYGYLLDNRRIYGNGIMYARSYSLSKSAVKEEAVDDYEAVIVTSDAAAPMAGAMMDAEVSESEEEAAGAIDDIPVNQSDTDYRDSDVPMAIWAPMLTTDADGHVTYTFTVPNANTTWRLKAVAWSKDMAAGSLMRDFVASKPVMVQPNLPRFMRTGDVASIQAMVMNNSDSTATVTTTIEIFNPMNGAVLGTKTETQEIGPKQNAVVNIDLTTPTDLNAIGYRVRSTNGTFSDGEQSVIRILPSQASLIETTPFYLNPGDKEWSMTLPSDEGARLSLTFCENPIWTIVSALPGLRVQIDDYANSAAAAIFSAAISQGIVTDNPNIAEAIKAWSTNPTDSALVSMLEKNQDLKIALLSSTPWVQAAQSQTERMAHLALTFDQKEVAGSISAGIEILQKLQKSDGGWAWGKWCDESSVWVTSNVLSMLGELKQYGWLPKDRKLNDMISKALKYYDKKVEKTDLLYALIRPMFKDVKISTNGQEVISRTLKEIRKDWKRYTDPAYKAMAAEALYLNGDREMAQRLMSSVSEFGVYTKDQGLKFPSVNSLYSYGILLQAYSMISPESKEVDGLRQQLIVRKQANDWGSAVVTSEVVSAVLSSGSKWTVPAEGAHIYAGDTEIRPTDAIETATGNLRANLSDYAGEQLTITTTGTGPAYGAVYAQFKRQMDQVKAASCDDLDIEKQMFVRRGTEWAVADSLKVGDRVKVQLTIRSKRNMQYVSIIDERPASFEPVEQIPGWIWSEGVGFYRENRDSQTNLHIVYMPEGTYLLTYEMNVGVAGQFMSGVATIQSQYAPELTAHSSGSMLEVRP